MLKRLFKRKRYFIVFWSGFTRNNNLPILGIDVISTENGAFPSRLKVSNQLRKGTAFSNAMIQNMIEVSRKEVEEWLLRNS